MVEGGAEKAGSLRGGIAVDRVGMRDVGLSDVMSGFHSVGCVRNIS